MATTHYPTDTLRAKDGSEFRMRFFKHASLALEIAGKEIYIDPVTGFADYAVMAKADLILISHHHYDHFEVEAVKLLWKPSTLIYCDRTTAALLQEAGITAEALRPGDSVVPYSTLRIEATAAYNISPEQLQFHPKEREDCGYVVTLGGAVKIYLSGDTEPTDELRALREKHIDIAFVCVNQPYTMTPDEAVEAVEAIRPAIYYPYHYGQVDEPTDVEALAKRLEGVCEVRIRPLA